VRFKKIFRDLEVLLRGPSSVGESVVSSDIIQELNITDDQDVFIKEALGLS
jgi:2-phosphoglycerate kinase